LVWTHSFIYLWSKVVYWFFGKYQIIEKVSDHTCVGIKWLKVVLLILYWC
jgi:hypothetical protein